ncbi:MAG: hypothetical protein AABW46_03425 [Nanoarchaeota archaeon]
MEEPLLLQEDDYQQRQFEHIISSVYNRLIKDEDAVVERYHRFVSPKNTFQGLCMFIYNHDRLAKIIAAEWVLEQRRIEQKI